MSNSAKYFPKRLYEVRCHQRLMEVQFSISSAALGISVRVVFLYSIFNEHFCNYW